MRDTAITKVVEHTSRTTVVKIKPLMDLHKAARTCDIREFKRFIADPDPFTFYFTNGDLFDAILFNDKRYARSGDGTVAAIDEVIDHEVNEMVSMLAPIKDRIIAIGHGNHEDTITKRCGTNPSKRLAEALGVPYGGYSYWIRLIMNRNGHRDTTDLFITHGFGGGTRTEGGSITKYAKYADRFDADIIVVGHDHRKQYVKYPILYMSEGKTPKLMSKSKVVVLGGSWKKAYSPDTSATWEETKGFPASEIGGVTIEINPRDYGHRISVLM